MPESIDPLLDSLASGTGRCGVNQINTCTPGATLVWNFIGSLAAGEGITLRVPPIVASGTPNGSELTFTATAGAPGLSAMKSETVVVQSGISFPYDLAIDPESDPAEAGALLTYTVAYGFRAVVGQADTVLRVEPPQGTTFVDATDGGIRRFTVEVGEDLSVGMLLETEATIRRSDGSGVKRANAVNRVAAADPVALFIETNSEPARQGNDVEVSMTVTNSSNTARTVTLHFIVGAPPPSIWR